MTVALHLNSENHVTAVTMCLAYSANILLVLYVVLPHVEHNSSEFFDVKPTSNALLKHHQIFQAISVGQDTARRER